MSKIKLLVERGRDQDKAAETLLIEAVNGILAQLEWVVEREDVPEEVMEREIGRIIQAMDNLCYNKGTNYG